MFTYIKSFLWKLSLNEVPSSLASLDLPPTGGKKGGGRGGGELIQRRNITQQTEICSPYLLYVEVLLKIILKFFLSEVFEKGHLYSQQVHLTKTPLLYGSLKHLYYMLESQQVFFRFS